MAISKTAQTLKTHLTDKLLKQFKIFLCLVWISYNQGSTNGYFRHSFAEVLEQLGGFGLGGTALHTLEDRIGNVLERNVQVFAYLRLLLHHCKYVLRETRRESIVNAYPFYTLYLGQGTEQVGQFTFAV